MGLDGAGNVPVCGKIQKLASELLCRVHSKDPIKGPWLVQPDGGVTVWTDASSIQVNETLVWRRVMEEV